MHCFAMPAFVVLDRYLHSRGLDHGMERGLLRQGEADSRSKMRLDMMILEITANHIPDNDATGQVHGTAGTARWRNA